MPKRNIVWIAIGTVTAILLWQAPEIISRRDQLYTDFRPLLDVRVHVLKRYVDEVDDEVLVRGAIDGMLRRLDPYSTYYDADEYKQVLKRTEGQFYGIGVGVEQLPTGELRVISPIEGSPAHLAGILAEDLILKIDGQDAAKSSFIENIDRIAGREGTKVKLTLHRPSTARTFDKVVRRGLVTVNTVRGWARTEDGKWDYLLDPRAGIGYIRISDFEGQTDRQFDEPLHALLTEHKMRGLIIDLRDNPGGLLDVVVRIANRFLTSGMIVSTRGKNTIEKPYTAQAEGTYPNFPVVVLVNKGSASASEILSGALHDHKRAVLVGETTFGKGSVQELIPIQGSDGDMGAMKLTTAYYYLPNGERIHGKGVVPDVSVALTPEQRAEMIAAQQRVYLHMQMYDDGENGSRPAEVVSETDEEPAGGADNGQDTSNQAETGDPTEAEGDETDESPATAPAGRVEIMIDPQLEEAVRILTEQLATRPAA